MSVPHLTSSSHLHPFFLTLPSYASQEKCNKKVNAFIHLFFRLSSKKKEKKEKTPISSIVSGSWSYPYPYRIARRQHPSLGKYLYMYIHVGGTRILDSAVLHAY